MSLSYSILIVILALAVAADMHRRQKAGGNGPNWIKTVVTGIGTILISLCGIGALILGLQSPYPMLGIVLFVLIFAGGLSVFLTFVNRRWSVRPTPDTTARS